MNVAEAKDLALRSVLGDLPRDIIEEALLIRVVEEKFLELFAQGRMNGTVHTCVGQEFSAAMIVGQLGADDWVTSNHRCHGHFISKTKNWQGLVDELMGRDSGVCRGVGSSQHLFAPGFLSNGPQGALVPVGTGIALQKKQTRTPGVVVSFVGEGTLGAGVLYEAMNLAAVYDVPQLIVCENNFYSQSTPQPTAVSGVIAARAAAFGIKTFTADTWNPAQLRVVAAEALAHVRSGHPAFLTLATYRLNAHSKGDDDRDPAEVAFFREHDPLARLLREEGWRGRHAALVAEVDAQVAIVSQEKLGAREYLRDQLPRGGSAQLRPVANRRVRMVQALNDAYRERLAAGAFLIGEDVSDPYGGAFKVTKGLSSAFPDAVRSSPISEAGLVGVAIGVALSGRESYAEIMFGDFMPLVFDQMLNNASKMHHMYAFQASVPLRVRTPMGGKRGYGPTHSQSLEKHFLGMDNTLVVALTSLVDPAGVIRELGRVPGPALILENKVDYGRQLWEDTPAFRLQAEADPFGALVLSPTQSEATLTIVSYGETARHLADQLEVFFEATDEIPELVALTRLHPLDLTAVKASLARTRALLVVEDGSTAFGVGAEVIARLAEAGALPSKVRRVGAAPVPVPSTAALEMELLPTVQRVIAEYTLRSTDG